MLYFSKIRIIVIVVLTTIFVYLAASNFFKFDDNLLSKKMNQEQIKKIGNPEVTVLESSKLPQDRFGQILFIRQMNLSY